MISILFFFVKRARKLPFQIFYGSSHVYIRLETIRSPNIFPSDECLPIKLWFINRSTHFPNIPQELPKQIFICHLFAYRGQHPIVSFQNSIFFSPSLSLILLSTIYRFLERRMERYYHVQSSNCIRQFCVSRRRDSAYKRKPFQDDYSEDFHELAALFMFSRRGSTWESSLLRSCISWLIYKADYWRRFLSSRNTDDSSQVSRVNFFFLRTKFIGIHGKEANIGLWIDEVWFGGVIG